MSERQRLDLLLLERGLATSRTKAQELISGGHVKVNGAVVRKAGEKIPLDASVELLKQEHPYVSRGALKLEAAFAGFPFSVSGKVVLDAGVSTGGFAQLLLQRGAKLVLGVDVGHGQLAEELKNDSRLVLFEKQDIRSLDPARLPVKAERFTADLSFISLRLILPVLPRFFSGVAEGIALVKPQFELSPSQIGANGIVRDAALRDEALARVKDSAEKCGYRVCGVLPSPIPGGDGNEEFLLHLAWPSSAQSF